VTGASGPALDPEAHEPGRAAAARVADGDDRVIVEADLASIPA
jgi:hypothetical protein